MMGLIATIDKPDLLHWLREQRANSRNKEEATTFGRVIRAIESGEYDG